MGGGCTHIHIFFGLSPFARPNHQRAILMVPDFMKIHTQAFVTIWNQQNKWVFGCSFRRTGFSIRGLPRCHRFLGVVSPRKQEKLCEEDHSLSLDLSAGSYSNSTQFRPYILPAAPLSEGHFSSKKLAAFLFPLRCSLCAASFGGILPVCFPYPCFKNSFLCLFLVCNKAGSPQKKEKGKQH